MIPVLFKIPLPFSILGFDAIPINSYGLLLVCGFFNAYFLLKKEFKFRGVDEQFASTVITIGMLSAIIGSRLFHVLEHPAAYTGSWHNFIKIFKGSGFSWYGGFVFAATSIIWTARRRGIHWTTMVDATAPAIAIGYGFGRMGCFLAGDGCYGRACTALDLDWHTPLCMAFPSGAVPTRELVLNTPLIELAGAILLFTYLQLIRRRLKTPTLLFAQMVIIHSVLRFVIEFVRVNPKLALGLSQAQWVSIVGVGIGCWLLWYGPRIKQPEPAPGKKP
jgi:phosphatidylglycerol---prolipoprotein diacylglyceryl transferase